MRVCATQAWPLFMVPAPTIGGIDGVEVGVVADDRGRLAAELERHALEPLAAERRDLAAGGGAAGEADLVDAGMA